MNIVKTVLVAGLLLALAACGKPTKEEMLQKADGAKKKAEVVAILGQPDDIAKIGPLEVWSYTASNGKVVFTMLAENVTLVVTEPERK